MSAEENKRELEGADYAALVRVASELDEQGLTTEADMIDQVLQKVAAATEEKGLGKGAERSMHTLRKALVSFCNKSIDSRGPNRRKIGQICDAAEDLRDMIIDLVGEGE